MTFSVRYAKILPEKRVFFNIYALPLTGLPKQLLCRSDLPRRYQEREKLYMLTSYADVTSLYVSEKTGRDDALGLLPVPSGLLGPFKSIAGALKTVADMRRTGFLQPLTVYLTDEEYDFSAPLRIAVPNELPYKNRTLVSDVTFAPYGRDKVLFSGGVKLSGFAPAEFGGVACLGLFLPEVKEGKWNFTDLYVNGKPASKTRLPREGYFYPASTENDVSATHVASRWFIAEEGDIPTEARNVEDITVNFCHYWVDEHGRIASFDPKTRKVTFDGRTRMTVSATKGRASTMAYYLENVAEAFQNPGEWYLDRPQGMLYYIPNEGETAENLVVYAPKTDRLIEVEGKAEEGIFLRNIRFERIAFAYTKGDFSLLSTRKLEDGSVVPEKVIADGQCAPELHGVLNFKDAVGCSVEGCDFYAYGSHGVVFGQGCSDCRVSATRFRYAAGGGVAIKGGSAEEPSYTHAHHNTVTDCLMEKLGLRYFSASGVLITHGYSNEISHNEIHDLYYSGICVGWRWGYGSTVCHDNLILKNHIYDLGKGILSDMGGVYTLGAQPGTRVEGNLIHDIVSRDYGGWGLYTDEGSAYITMKNNICYRCSSNCFHQHYGVMNAVRNNIFASAGRELVRMTRKEAHEGLLLENNIFLPDEGKPVYGNVTPLDFRSDRNLLYAKDGKLLMLQEGEKAYSLADIRKEYAMDLFSVQKKPGLRLPTEGGKERAVFSSAAAEEIGFVPIDMRDVGPRVCFA